MRTSIRIFKQALGRYEEKRAGYEDVPSITDKYARRYRAIICVARPRCGWQ